MPYLRAALNPHKQPKQEKPEVKSSSKKMCSVSDINLRLALEQWMLEDDRSTREELIRLGLA